MGLSDNQRAGDMKTAASNYDRSAAAAWIGCGLHCLHKSLIGCPLFVCSDVSMDNDRMQAMSDNFCIIEGRDSVKVRPSLLLQSQPCSFVPALMLPSRQPRPLQDVHVVLSQLRSFTCPLYGMIMF